MMITLLLLGNICEAKLFGKSDEFKKYQGELQQEKKNVAEKVGTLRPMMRNKAEFDQLKTGAEALKEDVQGFGRIAKHEVQDLKNQGDSRDAATLEKESIAFVKSSGKQAQDMIKVASKK